MTVAEMNERAQMVTGEHFTQSTLIPIDEEEDFERLVVSESEDEATVDLTAAPKSRQSQINTIIYNQSDDEEEPPLNSPVKAQKKSADQKKPKKKFNIFDMVKNGEDDNGADVVETQEFEIDSEDIRDRLAQLQDSDDSDNDASTSSKTNVAKTNRKRITIADSDSDDDGPTADNITAGSPIAPSASKEKIMSDDENDTDKENNDMESNKNKRDRSDSEESLPGEEILRKKKKVSRVIAAISDDED